MERLGKGVMEEDTQLGAARRKQMCKKQEARKKRILCCVSMRCSLHGGHLGMHLGGGRLGKVGAASKGGSEGAGRLWGLDGTATGQVLLLLPFHSPS